MARRPPAPPARRLARLLACVLLAACAVPTAAAQPAVLQGRVVDAETAAPLGGVTLVLVRDTILLAGAVTDAAGAYRFPPRPPGVYTLVVRHVGYRPDATALTLAGTSMRRDVRLRRAVVDLGEVSVEAVAQRDSADVRPSVLPLAAAQVRGVAGAYEDVLRALQALPGVLATSDFSSQFIVRGGSPDQNLILLDGIEVLNPYRLNGMGSVFNPVLLRDAELHAGGFPAPYGDRLSSVLAVTLREGTAARRLGGRVSLGVTGANAVLEGRAGGAGSWIIGARRSLYAFLPARFTSRLITHNDVAFPDFTDVQGKLVLRPGRRHRLQVTGLLGRDDFDVVDSGTSGRDASAARQRLRDDRFYHGALGAVWQYLPGAAAEATVYANVYDNRGASAFGGTSSLFGAYRQTPLEPATRSSWYRVAADTMAFTFDQRYHYRRATAGARFAYRTDRHLAEAGLGADLTSHGLRQQFDANDPGADVVEGLRDGPAWLSGMADSVDTAQRQARAHAYVQDRIALAGGRLFVQPGLRVDYYGVAGRAYLSPRLALSLQLDRFTTLRAAAGLYRQSPGLARLFEEGDLFSPARYHGLDGLRPETAVHVLAGVTRRLGPRWSARLEAYWKRLDALVVPTLAEVAEAYGRQEDFRYGPASPVGYRLRERRVYRPTATPLNAGRGHATGVELLLERPADDGWGGWASYAYARAGRDEPLGAARLSLPFTYDRRHTVNFVADVRLVGALRLGLTWRFGTGFPTTPPVGAEPLVATVADAATGGTRDLLLQDPETGYLRFLPAFGDAAHQRSARLPAYHRLDLRLTYHRTWRGHPLTLYLEAVNVYNRRNVLYYKYYVRVVEDLRPLPDALRRHPTPMLFREPVYMYPFLPAFGLDVAF